MAVYNRVLKIQTKNNNKTKENLTEKAKTSDLTQKQNETLKCISLFITVKI